MPAEEIADQAALSVSILAEVPAGDLLFLDQRDGSERLGLHINEGDVEFREPGSLLDLFEQTADALHGGPLAWGSHPTVVDGELSWTIR